MATTGSNDRALDEALVQRLTEEMAEEFDRREPPEGFPAFPDVPSGRYTSPEFHRLEQEHLWTKVWVCAGREEDLPENGSYVLFDELEHPLILVRGKDGVIRCFSNTCRHRGAPVVREPSGTVRNLRCQYHAWTYDITRGDLIAVTDERDFVGLCKEDRGLPDIRCETWGGWIFVNFDPEAMPLVEFLAPIVDEMAQFDCEDLRLIGTDHREIDCNWKVAVEAFQEVYHFRFIHDRGGTTLLDSKGATMNLLEHGNSRMVVPQSKAIVDATGRSGWDDYITLPDPTGLDPIPTVHPIVHSTSYSVTIFPNFVCPVGPTTFPVLLFFPDGPGRTRLRIYHYASSKHAELPPETWASRFATFAQIIDEDVENLDPMHRAMASPLYDGVPLSYQERRIWRMNEVIDQVIGIDRIPEDLRVPQLLDAYVQRS